MNKSEDKSEDKSEVDLWDYEIDISLRIEYLHSKSEQEINEIINKIISMYTFAETFMLFEFLYHIGLKSSISNIFKLQCLYAISTSENEIYKNQGLEAMNTLLSKTKDVPIPILIENIVILFDSKFLKESIIYFTEITNNHLIESDYRLKLITSLEYKSPKKLFPHILTEICMSFIQSTRNFIRSKILASQYILIKGTENREIIEFVELFLQEVAQDTELDENVRADAADVLLQLGTLDSSLTIGKNIILELSHIYSNSNIYENKQNIHDETIMSSGNDILSYLSELRLPILPFHRIKDTILSINTNPLIIVSLNRIENDRALYNMNCTLSNICQKVWGFIQVHEYKDEMILRMLEELEEMSGTCSSGYAFRLINVLSGFCDKQLQISWSDQIASNLSGRLQAEINKIEDEELKGIILEEMIISPIHYNQRQNFLTLFGKVISQIRENMWKEFNQFIPDTDFDLYFRKAIMKFEGCLV